MTQEDQKKETKVINFLINNYFIIIEILIDNFYLKNMKFPDVLNDAAIPEYEPIKVTSEKKKNKK